jgi:hypothetical protein
MAWPNFKSRERGIRGIIALLAANGGLVPLAPELARQAAEGAPREKGQGEKGARTICSILVPVLASVLLRHTIARLSMSGAFLLRFQEQCLPDDSSRNPAADPTKTRIAAEQPDVGRPGGDHGAFPPLPGSAVEPTRTAIKGEAPDESVEFGMTGLPRISISRRAADPTHTLVRAEAPDQSAGCGMTALPFYKSAACPTSTCTRTLAETNDTDLGHAGSHALPRCSSS